MKAKRLFKAVVQGFFLRKTESSPEGIKAFLVNRKREQVLIPCTRDLGVFQDHIRSQSDEPYPDRVGNSSFWELVDEIFVRRTNVNIQSTRVFLKFFRDFDIEAKSA
jgi:hypothetical protein